MTRTDGKRLTKAQREAEEAVLAVWVRLKDRHKFKVVTDLS